MEEKILDSQMQTMPTSMAGFGWRLGAYIIDIIPIIVLANILVYLILGLNPFDAEGNLLSLAGAQVEESSIARVIVRYLSFLLWIVYGIMMDASKYQGTHGKWIIGIKVVNIKYERLTTTQSIKRNLSKILSYIVLGLGFFWIIFNQQKQGWHDLIAKTYVVKTEKND